MYVCVCKASSCGGPKRDISRAVAVCLALLCVLQLAALTALGILYSEYISVLKHHTTKLFVCGDSNLKQLDYDSNND